ncbi:MAG: NAD(P)/FAD-dependent oxidoreductase, partial [Candidatus Aenigmarchaeota archaeon]
MVHDLIIVGGGPAGLSAALTSSYLKLNHVVLETTMPGGALMHNYPSKKVDSFLGLKDLTGKEVAERMMDHVKAEGSGIRYNEEVKEIKKRKNIFEVRTNRGVHESKSVLIAIGTCGCPRKLGIPGEDFENVHYSMKDPNDFKGKTCFVLGGGDSAVETAVMLDKVCKKVYLAHRKNKFRAMEENQREIEKSNCEILWNTELKKIEK